MKEELMTEVMQQMLPYLDNAPAETAETGDGTDTLSL